MYIFTIQPDDGPIKARLDQEDNWSEPVKVKIYSPKEFESLTDEEKIAHYDGYTDDDDDLNTSSAMWNFACLDVDLSMDFEQCLFSKLYPEKYSDLEEKANSQKSPLPFILDAIEDDIESKDTDEWKVGWINQWYEFYDVVWEYLALSDPNLVITHAEKKD